MPTNRTEISWRQRAALAAVGAGVLAVTVALPASAHVLATASNTSEGAHTVVTLSVPHGCEGSATTSVAVQIPESITSVTPTRNPLYEITTVHEDLAEPVDDGHGGEYNTRVAEVRFDTETPLPDDMRDTFELAMALPEDAAGTTLYFPAVQTCEDGENAWIDIPAPGQDPHELDYPAPAITVTSADGSEGATGSGALGVAALVVATLALGVGLVGLLRKRT